MKRTKQRLYLVEQVKKNPSDPDVPSVIEATRSPARAAWRAAPKVLGNNAAVGHVLVTLGNNAAVGHVLVTLIEPGRSVKTNASRKYWCRRVLRMHRVVSMPK